MAKGKGVPFRPHVLVVVLGIADDQMTLVEADAVVTRMANELTCGNRSFGKCVYNTMHIQVMSLDRYRAIPLAIGTPIPNLAASIRIN